jgi:hypothetical protein
MLISFTNLLAYDCEVDGICYNLINDSTCSVTSNPNGGYSGNVVIPENILYNNRTITVISIGSNAFRGCNSLFSVSIPNTVTSIGSYAFAYSKLYSIVIPNSVTSVGASAFYECSNLLKCAYPDSINNPFYYTYAVSYPASDSLIEDGIIWNSNKTTLYFVPYDFVGEFSFPESTTSIENYAFLACAGITTLTIPNSVTSIGDYAFALCMNISKLTISGSVASIGEYAFYYCNNLTIIDIPSSITRIGQSAFKECTELKRVNIADIAAWCNISFDNSYSNPFYYAKYLYINDEEITELEIPNSINEIGNYVFYGCSRLKSVSIPSSITKIGDDAFYGCEKLDRVDITDLVAWCNISGSAFSNGYSLFLNGNKITNLEIPESITEVRAFAFYNCSGLTTVSIPSSVTTIGDNAFGSCSGLTSVSIPNSVTEIGDRAFYECSCLTSVSIPNSVTRIGEAVFYKCEGLTSVSIPNSVTEIGASAFMYCSNLTSVSIPNSVTEIGGFAFWGCNSLTSISIPNSITEIGLSAFYECNNINNLIFEDGETMCNVFSDAFAHSTPLYVYFGRQMNFRLREFGSSIETVGFGKYVKSITNDAFKDDSNIRIVNVYNLVPPETYDTFSEETYANGTLYVPESSIEAYAKAPCWKDFKNIKALDDYNTITDIGVDCGTTFRIDGNTLHLIGDSLVRVVSINGSTIYNGNGNRDINLDKGMYIVVIGDKVSKIVVK